MLLPDMTSTAIRFRFTPIAEKPVPVVIEEEFQAGRIKRKLPSTT